MRGHGTVARIVISLLILAGSIGVVIGASWLGVDFTLGEQLLLTATLFLTGTVLELLVLVERLNVKRNEDVGLWTVWNEGERRLANIRTMYRRILEQRYADDDLFVQYFHRRFEDLQDSLAQATEKGELRVHSHHFESTEAVLSAFSGDTSGIHRYTWVIEPDEQMFPDQATVEYFRLVDEMVKKRTIGGVRALLIVKRATDLDRPHVRRLLQFYCTNRSYSCRIIDWKDYDELRVDSQLPACEDFGVYGNALLFVTETYEPETVGLFVKDQQRVDRYIRFFDKLWASALARDNPSTERRKLSLVDLLEYDRSAGRDAQSPRNEEARRRRQGEAR